MPCMRGVHVLRSMHRAGGARVEPGVGVGHEGVRHGFIRGWGVGGERWQETSIQDISGVESPI